MQAIKDFAKGDQALANELERDYQLRKLLDRKNDEQKNIRAAKEKWALIRRKIKAIRAMAKLGGKEVYKMIERNMKNKEKKGTNQKMEPIAEDDPSKFIIASDSYWNL